MQSQPCDKLCSEDHSSVLQEFNKRKRLLLQERRELIDLSMINPDLPPERVLIDKLVESAVRPQLHRYAVAPLSGP